MNAQNNAMLLFVLMTLGSPVFAQTATGEASGTVTDPIGAVIPGATLRLI